MRNRKHFHLLILLAVGYGLRAVLAFSGGQNFWYDEIRYERSFKFVRTLLAGHWRDAAAWASDIPHPAFTWIAAPAAFLQMFLAHVFQRSLESLSVMPCLYFSLFSVAIAIFVERLAKISGATSRTAFFAALLCVSASSMFLYARHLLPYDISLAFALGALAIGWKSDRFASLLWAGFMCGLAAVTYFGYAPLCALILVSLFAQRLGRNAAVRNIAGLAIAFLAPLFFVFVLFTLSRHQTFSTHVLQFAQSIKQGDPDENWSLPFSYLWTTDPMLLGLSLIGIGLGLRRPQTEWKILPWISMIAALWAWFALSGLMAMVVYGRLVRALVPFLAIVASFGLEMILSRQRPRTFVAVFLLAAFVGEGTLRFMQAASLRFPADLRRSILAQYPQVAEDYTVMGPSMKADPILPETRFILLNARTLYPITGSKEVPIGKTLLRVMHPLQFHPYQFEGYGARQRLILETTDISIRLLERNATSSPKPDPSAKDQSL